MWSQLPADLDEHMLSVAQCGESGLVRNGFGHIQFVHLAAGVRKYRAAIINDVCWALGSGRVLVCKQVHKG